MTLTSPRVGRPLDESVSASITDAVLGLLGEVGIAEMTVDAVANRAGVSKASIYRRWSSKEELVVEVIGSLVSKVEVTSTGDIREDLVQFMGRFQSFLCDVKAGSLFPRMMGEVNCGSALGRRYAESVILPKRALIGKLITEAKQRGELKADLDVEIAVDMLSGSLIVRKLLSSYRTTGPDTDARMVDALLDGWRA